MRNFEANAYIEGTAARKLDLLPEQGTRIIPFPERHASRSVPQVQTHQGLCKQESERASITISSNVLYALLHGSAAGQASGRMTAAQAVGTICLFAAIAFGTLLIGL